MSTGLKSVASPATGSMFDVRFTMEEMGLEEDVAVEEEEEVKGQVVLPNKNIRRNKEDILYHLGLSNTSGLQEMFGDVKFVCMGGSALRAHRLAEKLQEALNIKYPPGAGIVPIGKTERFSLYKMGPVISVSHGMGMPSMSILLHEITKLLYHAKASNVVFVRVGTCGGVGCPPGTVILTTEGVNAKLQSIYKMVNLGKTRKFATNLDASLIEEGLAAAEQEPRIPCVSGRTYGADDFYEGQGRLDGALIDYTREERDTWMAQLKDANVRNIEMEAPCFAAFCNRAGIRAMICCAALLNRLLGDQVTATPEEMNQYTERALDLAIRVIQRRLASDAASSSSSSN